MSKLESTLTVVIMLLVLVIVGLTCKVYDMNQENMKQRVELFKECAQDFGARNCNF